MVEIKEEYHGKHRGMGIVGAVCFFATVIAALVLIFARESAWIIIFTTLILAFFGIVVTKGHCCESNNKCGIEKKK